jgi:flagellar basal-body rod modification protein FlgD
MVSSVSGTSGASATSSVTGGAQIASNFDTFLRLLTTQLQNQNPLDPLDTNQFTEQLVQFASVEQQIQTNSTLSALLSLNDTSRMSNAVNFIGKKVVAEGDTSVLSDGSATWYINAAKAAPNSTIVIQDADGNQVYSQPASLAQGSQSFTWDGRNSSGQFVNDGFYTMTVAARDASGGPVTTSTDVQGTVSTIDMVNGEPVLTLGNMKVKLSSIKSIVDGNTGTGGTGGTGDTGGSGDDTGDSGGGDTDGEASSVT